MTSYIGCGGLILIAVFIGFLFIRRRKIEDEIIKFYKENDFYAANDFPESVLQAIRNRNGQPLKSSLVIEHKPFAFYWLITSTSSTLIVNNTAQTSHQYFLTIVFPPGTVSENFIMKAESFKAESSSFKDFFVLNTEKPIRAERLADGYFFILWQVLNTAEVYRQKLDWLNANLE